MDVTSYLLGKKAGGGSKPPVLQDKEVTITENGTTNVTADDGYDGLSEVEVTTNLPPADIDDYFDNTISSGSTGGYQNDYPGWVKSIKKLKSPLTVTGTSLAYAFYSYAGKTVPEISSTSNVTNMKNMFDSCKNLTTIPNIDTSNVTNTSYMFRSCFNLSSIPNLDTSNVTNMSNMFLNCNNLASVPNLDTSNATDMGYMFSGCKGLKSLPNNIDVSHSTSLAYFCGNCNALEDVPVLNASGVNSSWGLQGTFDGCKNLTDTSVDNILQMCISATSYHGTKTLSQLGLSSNDYPASKIQALPHYQDFIDAGWTIGY